MAESRLAIGIKAHTVWVVWCGVYVHSWRACFPTSVFSANAPTTFTICQRVLCFLNLKFTLPNGGG